MTVKGVRYGAIDAKLESKTADGQEKGAAKSNVWVTVSLAEGKNREVRKVMEFLGLTVNRLIRISYGPFQLGKLEPGVLEEVPRHVVRQQLGAAAPAGLDRKRQRHEKAGPKA